MKNFILGSTLTGVFCIGVIIASNNYEQDVINILLFFPVILFFSLVTYKMPVTVFKYWWSYAKYAVPVTFIISALINSGIVYNNPLDPMENVFNIFLLIILYTIFTLGSLIQIYRGYKKRKA